MNYSKKLIGITFILTLIAITSLYIFRDKLFLTPVKNEDSSLVLTPPLSEWRTYKNTSYHYEIKHPLSRNESTVDQFEEINSAKEVSFGGDVSGLTIQVERPSFFKDYPNTENAENRALEKKKYELLSLDTRSFAEALHQYQMDDPNPYINEKQVGQLKEVTISGRNAYTFTLTKSFGGLVGGYLIGDNPHLYIITDNPTGDKLIIHHLADDPISKEMLRTFKFTL